MEEDGSRDIQSEETQGEEMDKQLSREDILAMSRNENKNGDEKEQQAYVKAGTFAFSAGLVLAGIILIVSVFVEDKLRLDILLLISAMQAVQQLIVGFSHRKMRKVSLVVGIAEAVCAVMFLVLWIIQLCGVIL